MLVPYLYDWVAYFSIDRTSMLIGVLLFGTLQKYICMFVEHLSAVTREPVCDHVRVGLDLFRLSFLLS
jgi:hypothetical protein